MTEKKVVLISGGTSGIGLAAAQILLHQGWTPVLLGRDEEKGRAAERKLPGSVFLACDITNSAACDEAAEKAAAMGVIQGVVVSAGIYGEGLLENATDEEIHRFFSVNVYGAMYLCRAALPYMKSCGGAVVTVASDAALEGNVQCSLYGATKGALVAFTRSFALEAAVYGIRVNAVCPGDVDTPLLARQISQYGGNRSDMGEQYPLGRIGKAEEVGEVIAFLLSEKASFMTGAAVPVDGGLTDW